MWVGTRVFFTPLARRVTRRRAGACVVALFLGSCTSPRSLTLQLGWEGLVDPSLFGPRCGTPAVAHRRLRSPGRCRRLGCVASLGSRLVHRGADAHPRRKQSWRRSGPPQGPQPAAAPPPHHPGWCSVKGGAARRALSGLLIKSAR
jgi:hypothetical protein